MGYIIEYKSGIVKKPLKTGVNYRLWAMTAGFFVLFLVCSHLLWPDKLTVFRDVILPEGNPVAALVSDLQNGESFSQAVESFCQQVFGDG